MPVGLRFYGFFCYLKILIPNRTKSRSDPSNKCTKQTGDPDSAKGDEYEDIIDKKGQEA